MAVYTEVSNETLVQFLADYDIGALLSFKGITEGIENSNYLLRTDQKSYILTLYEKRVQEKDLPFFLSLMNHLSERGIHCPTPIGNRHGDVWGHLEGRAAALVSFLDGLWVRHPRPEHCQQVGKVLACIHDEGQNFSLQRENTLNLHILQSLLEAVGNVDHIKPHLTVELYKELNYITTCWPSNLPHGVIHGDLFPDNAFFTQGVLSGVIDFYFACNDFLAYDIAICINAWCFEDNYEFNADCARALLSGYQERRPLEDCERKALPILCRGSAMRFLLTRLYDWILGDIGETALVKPKDPLDYLARVRFHRRVESITAYGLDP
ncbi:MAG: homoserine kinase [Parvularculales bacterium]